MWKNTFNNIMGSIVRIGWKGKPAPRPWEDYDLEDDVHIEKPKEGQGGGGWSNSGLTRPPTSTRRGRQNW